MKGSPRISAEERRQAIIDAIKGVFAEKGFERTTTRELAEVAGVSEALLFKHFPSKEAMYAAIHEDFIKNADHEALDRIMEMEPSTATLVEMVHSIMRDFIKGPPPGMPPPNVPHLLMTRSFLEDGNFARMAFEQITDTWIAKFKACLKAADKAGDLNKSNVNMDIRGWCVHHIAINMMLTLNPEKAVVDYKVSREQLVEQVVWFSLVGIGLKENAIKRYYSSKNK